MIDLGLAVAVAGFVVNSVIHRQHEIAIGPDHGDQIDSLDHGVIYA